MKRAQPPDEFTVFSTPRDLRRLLELGFVVSEDRDRTLYIRRGRRKKSITTFYVLYAIQQGRCFYCKKQVTPAYLQLDHVVPRSKGGEDHIWNRVLCCKRCNRNKADYSLQEFDKPSARRYKNFRRKLYEYVREYGDDWPE